LARSWELALFGRSRLCVQCVITLFPQSTCPSYCSGGNWLCFARFGPAAASATLHTREKLASFGAIAPSVGGAFGPAVRRLSRPMQGKLGSFGAMSPSGGSADAFAGPRPSSSVPAIGFVCTTAPDDDSTGDLARPRAPVVARRLALFRTHSFGVPRLRGSDWSFPPEGGTPNSPRLPSGISVPLWQIFDEDACWGAHDETLPSCGLLSVILYSVVLLSYRCTNSSSSEISTILTGVGSASGGGWGPLDRASGGTRPCLPARHWQGSPPNCGHTRRHRQGGWIRGRLLLKVPRMFSLRSREPLGRFVSAADASVNKSY
jgi:hypothetical protein